MAPVDRDTGSIQLVGLRLTDILIKASYSFLPTSSMLVWITSGSDASLCTSGRRWEVVALINLFVSIARS